MRIAGEHPIPSLGHFRDVWLKLGFNSILLSIGEKETQKVWGEAVDTTQCGIRISGNGNEKSFGMRVNRHSWSNITLPLKGVQESRDQLIHGGREFGGVDNDIEGMLKKAASGVLAMFTY